VTFHFCESSLGQVFGALNPVTFASRFGPRHWGQSCAQAQLVPINSTQPNITPLVAFMLFMIAPL
jgi:hypothetical protein